MTGKINGIKWVDIYGSAIAPASFDFASKMLYPEQRYRIYLGEFEEHEEPDRPHWDPLWLGEIG